MKPMKLTSLVVMLLVGFSAAAQEEFFDDVYFSSSKEKKKEKTEEKVIQSKKEDAKDSSSAIVLASASDSQPTLVKDRDVDEYNRRYTSVDVEEPYNEDLDEEDGTYIEELPDNNQKVTKKSEAVRIPNIPNVSYVIILRVRSRLPVQTRWICI